MINPMAGISARIILCDYAQASPDGKLHMIGAHWSFINPGAASFGIGITLEVDQSEMVKPHSFELVLRDADGHLVNDPMGNPVRINGTAPPQTHPPDHPAGMPVKAALAFNLAGLPLQPSSRYQLVFTVDNASMVVEDFSTRAAPPQLKAS